MLPEGLQRLATAQYGLVSHRQLTDVPLTRRALNRLVTGRRLVPVRRGVYLVAGAPPLPEQPVLAAVLAVGPLAVASHWTAAALWGLPGAALSSTVHLATVGNGRLRRQGVRWHDTVDLRADDCSEARGVPVTSPARTVCDLAAVAAPELLLRMVDDASRHALLTPDELARLVHRLAGAGARHLEPVRAALARQLPGQERTDSDLEVEALREVAEARLPRPMVNFPLVADGRVLRLDLAWPSRRVAVELKGWSVHGRRDVWERDHERENLLRRLGWTVFAYPGGWRPGTIASDLTPLLA